MKTPDITSQHNSRTSLLALVLGLALLGPPGPARADDLLVNSFDFDLSGIAWQNWRFYVLGHDLTWDPSQDANGNANSGSMYITVNWPTMSDPLWNNGWNDVQVAFAAGSFDPADYLELEAYIKIDVENSSVAMGGTSYGISGLYLSGGTGGWRQIQGYRVLNVTNGWQRISGSLAAIPPGTTSSQVVVGLISQASHSLTNTVRYWLDNIRLVAPPSVHTNRPSLTIAKAPPAGLTCMASAPADPWQRQMVRTLNPYYGWDTATAASNTTTYAITISDFPRAEHHGFEAMMYLIPMAGISNPDGASVDWDSAHVAYFTIGVAANGTGNGNFRYKVNSPGAENFQSWTDHNCATGPLGTWQLTFNHNTNVTITAPDGTSKSLTISETDAANFQGDVIAYFGVRPGSATRIGLSATFSRLKITGAAAAIDDNFVSAGPPYDLDSNTWVRKAAHPPGIFITAPDAR